jgi:ABC-type transport system involved in cytochrome c biogenesis permease component|tara:strand:+ start:52 stop:753 length:702 start_codon:yes stop_codon:yes gene_type:complete
MQTTFPLQLKVIFKQCIKSEFSELNRLISPFLFALSILVLFHFSFDVSNSTNIHSIFVGQLFLVVLFALQICLMKQFDIELRDQSLKILKTYPISISSLFVAKLIVTFFSSLMITMFTLVFAVLLNFSQITDILFNPGFLGSLGLVLLGVSSIGCLLSALVYQSSGREILFPILFFSLASPLFIVGIQSSLVFLAPSDLDTAVLGQNCLTILGGLNIIYFTLGVLLFEEIMKT